MSWSPSLVADIFDIASQASARCARADDQIMEIVQMNPEIDTDPDLPIQRATAMFACFTGKMEEFRCMEQGEEKEVLLSNLIGYVEITRAAIEAADTLDDKGAKVEQLRGALSILEAELLCEERNWEEVETRMENAINDDEARGGDYRKLEALVAVLAQYPKCPNYLTIKMVERLLETLSPELDAERDSFARWTHHVVHALLNRGMPEDEERLGFYLGKVVSVMDSHGGNIFSNDHCRQFASIAYNKGMGKFRDGDFEGGCRWCELGLDIASRIEGARGTYTSMLQRYKMLQQRFTRRL